jgi:hypothetical protein
MLGEISETAESGRAVVSEQKAHSKAFQDLVADLLHQVAVAGYDIRPVVDHCGRGLTFRLGSARCFTPKRRDFFIIPLIGFCSVDHR